MPHDASPRHRAHPGEDLSRRTRRAELAGLDGDPGTAFRGTGREIATVTFDFDVDGRTATPQNVAN